MEIASQTGLAVQQVRNALSWAAKRARVERRRNGDGIRRIYRLTPHNPNARMVSTDVLHRPR
jgi:hypothetical protein